MSREDLIPLNKRTKEEQKEITKKGGIASGESRRRKKSLKEAADLFLSLPVAELREKNKLLKAGVSEKDMDYQMAMVVGLTKQAMKGDAKAAKVVIEILGGSQEDDARKDALEKLDEVLEEIGGVI